MSSTAISAVSPMNPASVVADDSIPTSFTDAYNQEVQIVQRPGVSRRILATAAGAFLPCLYFGSYSPIAKGVYAVMAAGLGINVGIYVGDPRVDALAAGALYYAFYSIGASYGYSNMSNNVRMEAMGAVAAGLAVNYAQASMTASPCSC